MGSSKRASSCSLMMEGTKILLKFGLVEWSRLDFDFIYIFQSAELEFCSFRTMLKTINIIHNQNQKETTET